MIKPKTRPVTITVLENLQAEGFVSLVRQSGESYFIPSKTYPNPSTCPKEDVLLVETAIREMTDDQLLDYTILI